MSFPRYDEYKSSGVDWLGDVPNHWDVDRFKRSTVSCRNGIWGSEAQGDENDIKCVRVADFDRERLTTSDEIPTIRNVTESERADRTLSQGNLLLEKSGGGDLQPVGFVVLYDSNEPAVCSNFVAKVELAEGMNPSYWRYCHAAAYSVRLNYRSIKQTSGIQNLDQSQYLDERAPFPPLDEQRAIASFLDAETGKIDRLVLEQRRLIELLKEKRQAVISHAVTKGLNPNAPLKPSGIQWLGDVPEHWEVGKVKHYFDTCSGGTPNTAQQSLYYAEDGDGYPWVRTTDLNNDFVTSVPVYITGQAIKDTACDVLPKGTVMVAMYGGAGTVGKNGLLMFPATINQAVCGLLPSETHDVEYVFRFMQFYRPYWMIGAESSRKDPNISQDRVKNAPFPKPPIEEQHEIVTFINEQLEAFNTLLAEAERAIELLQERRTALISAAVTGKIDLHYAAEELE